MEQQIDTGALIKGIIGSLVRFGLGGVVAWLVQKGLITGEQGEMIIPAVILAVITVAWAIYRKYKIQQRIAVALELPAGSDADRLDRAVAEKKSLT